MKGLTLIAVLLVSISAFGQKKKKQPALNLRNALVIAQVDAPEDRYSMEITLTDIFSRNGVQTTPSLNVLKLGSDAQLLATDSLDKIVKSKGIDTYVLVTVRGYDTRHKVANLGDDFKTALSQASFYELYREGIVSVSLEFKFFREGKCVYGDMVKCNNVGSRDTVLKRMRKKVGKQLVKRWK